MPCFTTLNKYSASVSVSEITSYKGKKTCLTHVFVPGHCLSFTSLCLLDFLLSYGCHKLFEWVTSSSPCSV